MNSKLWLALTVLAVCAAAQDSPVSVSSVQSGTLPAACNAGARNVFFVPGVGLYTCPAGAWVAPGSTQWSALVNPLATTSLAMGGFASAFTWTNPSLGDPNDHYGMQYTCTYDQNDTANNNFSDNNCFQTTFNFNWGQALYGAGTNAKRTGSIHGETYNAIGSGQHIGHNYVQNCYGMGDCAKDSTTITCYGGNVAGDETSCGLTVVSRIQQGNRLITTGVSGSPSRSSCPSSMALAQSVSSNATVQTVAVNSTTGCVTGAPGATDNWQALDWAGATGSPNWEVVQVTVIDPTHVSARFTANHSNTTTMRAALVLPVYDTSGFGQDRVAVDRNGAIYSAGTVAFTKGTGAIAGSGTSWSNAMVGGDSTSPGCLQATAEDQTNSPFGTGASALHSWWEISPGSISGSTAEGIFSYSVAGSGAYNGASFSGSAYSVHLCGRVLGMVGNNLILSPNTGTWIVDDTIEVVLAPYPDVSIQQYDLSFWTPGGTYRGFEFVRNLGSQPFGGLINVENDMAGNNGSGNAAAFSSVITVNSNAANAAVNYILYAGSGTLKLGAWSLPAGTAGFDSRGYWYGTYAIGPDPATNQFEICFTGCGFGYDPYHVTLTGNPYTNNSTSMVTYSAVGLDFPGTASQSEFLHLGSPFADFTLYRAGSGNSPGTGVGLGGLDWIMNVTNRSPGPLTPGTLTTGDVLAFGGLGHLNGYGCPLQGTATSNTTNVSSCMNLWATSVWNGTAAATILGGMQMVPGSGINNAPQTLTMNIECAATSYDTGIPCQPWSVSEAGVMTLINNGPSFESAKLVFNPAATTSARSLNFPDASGTPALFTAAPGTGATTPAFGATSPCSAATVKYVPTVLVDGSAAWAMVCQ